MDREKEEEKKKKKDEEMKMKVVGEEKREGGGVEIEEGLRWRQEERWMRRRRTSAIQSFSEQVVELDHIIRRMILESLGLEKYLKEHLESTSYLLRMMKYKGPQTNETKLALLPSHRQD
ncbi:hypothetical protein ACE6H2_024354 [Prunus campanulata]